MLRVGQTISQVVLHMGVAFAVGYAISGSLALGGAAALVEPICNVVLLPLHDRIWARIKGAAAFRPRSPRVRVSRALATCAVR